MFDRVVGKRLSGGTRAAGGVKPIHLVLLVAILGVGGAAVASAGSSGVHACVNKRTRVLTVPRNGRCGRGQSALTWSIQGPRGVAGTPGRNGTNGINGAPGLSASASTSSTTNTVLTASNQTVMSTSIAVPGSARIEASGGANIKYDGNTSNGAQVTCQLMIAPQGGSFSAMGQPYSEEYGATAVTLTYDEPLGAGGGKLEGAGTYTVELVCNRNTSSGFATTSTFETGDLNVLAAAP